MRSPHTTMKRSPHSPHLEKAHMQQRRPNAAKKKKKMNVDGDCTSLTKINQKLIKMDPLIKMDHLHVNVKCKTIKLLDDNIAEKSR